ncbi:hypothetical protein BJY04DRAFT_190824 [Aspergillus karnatakaensis]|uniref:uncharacterized protein n=1 Tax=Aspergillus karnatakaensis TaxID=1810916 RepID=UPI003CCCBCD7
MKTLPGFQGPDRHGNLTDCGMTRGGIAVDRSQKAGTKNCTHPDCACHKHSRADEHLPKVISDLCNFVLQLEEEDEDFDLQTVRSGLTSYENDDKGVWRGFRRRFINAGLRTKHLAAFSDQLIAHLSELKDTEKLQRTSRYVSEQLNYSNDYLSSFDRQSANEPSEPDAQSATEKRATGYDHIRKSKEKLPEKVSVYEERHDDLSDLEGDVRRTPYGEWSRKRRHENDGLPHRRSISPVRRGRPVRRRPDPSESSAWSTIAAVGVSPTREARRRRTRHDNITTPAYPHPQANPTSMRQAPCRGAPMPQEYYAIPGHTYPYTSQHAQPPPPTFYHDTGYQFQSSPGYYFHERINPSAENVPDRQHSMPYSTFPAAHPRSSYTEPLGVPPSVYLSSSSSSASSSPASSPSPSRGSSPSPSLSPSPPTPPPASRRSPVKARRDSSTESQIRALEWKKMPDRKLYPLAEAPALPEGWDWRIDGQNRLFYVDTYARGYEKRCFWQPPRQEDMVHRPLPIGWERVCTLFGRIYWVHRMSQIISYEHPGVSRQMCHDDNGCLLLLDAKRNILQPWNKIDLQSFVLDDEDVACQIVSSVWHTGLSDEAVKVRGELWWGNSSVEERHLRLTPLPDTVEDEPTANPNLKTNVKQPRERTTYAETVVDSTQKMAQASCSKHGAWKDAWRNTNYKRPSVEDIPDEAMSYDNPEETRLDPK